MINLITGLVDKYVPEVIKSYGIGWGVAVTVLIVAVLGALAYMGWQ